ncbi:TonB-dependent receptor [Paraglaciecola arctica]|uniref:TonB-dependent receptor n=1 Tax=Paraglaciecola arctica TaxID=1128911 RepID=UPI001C066374|nr:TonB-dependent receptor [Paraglaciecola arctica]MBU3005370.1 TonB-dependent receptor [Paraglaciecola arctica]
MHNTHQKFQLKLGHILISAAILSSVQNTAIAQDSNQISDDTEVIEVKGLRGSLAKALDQKRAADNIRDVINAEDIGKLPDKNIAEALQRITGVQIGRSFGEGSEIAVRGISKNRVEVNGQTQPGAGSGRGVTFEELPAEMFESLEIIKSPTADEIEGGLGAIVRLNTRKPLSQKGFVLSGNLEASYYDRAGEVTPNGSAFVSNRWTLNDGAEVGALFNVTHSERQLRQDFFNVRAWRAQDGWNEDLDGNGVIGEGMIQDENGIITNLNDAAFKPEQSQLKVTLQDRQRTAYRAGFQYRPNKKNEWYLDASFSSSEATDQQYQLTAAINGRNASRDYREGYTHFTDMNTALAGLVGNIKSDGDADRGVNLNISSNKNPNEREIYTLALSNKWSINDDVEMFSEFSRGHGEQFNDQLYGSSGVAWGNLPYIYYDFGVDTDIPSLVPYEQGTVELTDDARLDLSDPLGYQVKSLTFQEQWEENDDTAFKLDFDYHVEFGGIQKLEFGVRFAKRSAKRWRNVGRDADGPEDGILTGMTYEQIEELVPGSTLEMPFSDLLDGASGDFPRSWITINSEYILNYSDEFKSIVGVDIGPDVGWGFDVEEQTQAIYFKANFDGELADTGLFYNGNFGVRYIETDQSATGSLSNGDGSYTPYSQNNTYSNTLPSFNINFELQDDLFLRLAAAKTMARPDVADIAPITNVFFWSNAGTTGNTDLIPETVIQLDASIEWYFTEGAILSAAIYKKDFSDAIEDGFLNRCFTVPNGFESEATFDSVNCAADGTEAFIGLATKLNAGNAVLKGIEVNYQQSFTELPEPWDGLGVQANYSYTDSDVLQILTTGFAAPLQDFSENSYNAVLFYEKYGFTGRLAYNWRDDYYDTLTQSNSAEFARPYGQLDASINYEISQHVTVGLSVTNVQNEPEQKYQEITERFLSYRVNDTRYALTIRGRM